MVRETGRSLADVARAPYHETLWLWGHFVAADRIDALRRRGERLRDAASIAVGFHEPKKLTQLGRDYDRDIGLMESSEDVMRRAPDILAEMIRVNAKLDADNEQRLAAETAALAPDPALEGTE